AVVERTKSRPQVYLPSEQIPIEERIEQLLSRLSETEACGFEDLFDDINTRAGLVVTFLALLEMIRLKLIRVFQSGVVGPIRVYKRARPADAPRPLHDPEQVHAEHLAAAASKPDLQVERDGTTDVADSNTPDLKVGPTGEPDRGN